MLYEDWLKTLACLAKKTVSLIEAAVGECEPQSGSKQMRHQIGPE